MRNRWRFSSLLLVTLMLSGCFGMHADSVKWSVYYKRNTEWPFVSRTIKAVAVQGQATL